MAEDKPGINLPKVQYRGSTESWNELGSYISRSSSRFYAQQEYDQSVQGLKDLHGKEKSLENITETKRLYKSALQQKNFLKSLDNIQEIAKENEIWSAREKKRINALGGPYASDSLREVDNYEAMLTNEGLRIGENKVREDGFTQIALGSKEFLAAINDGDLTGAKKKAEQVTGLINRLEADKIISKDEAAAFRKNAVSVMSDLSMKSVLEQNAYIEASKGKDAAKKHINDMQKVFSDEFSSASNSLKGAYLRRKNLLNKLEETNPLPELANTNENKTVNFLSGRLTTKELVTDIDNTIGVARSQLKKGNIKQGSRIKVQNYIEELEATKKFASALNYENFDVTSTVNVKENPVLDFSLSSAEAADKLGIKNNTAEFKQFAALRGNLYKQVYVKDDVTATNINIYKAIGAASGSQPIKEPIASEYNDNLSYVRDRIDYENKINSAMGGYNGHSTELSNNVDALLRSNNPRYNAGVDALIEENPGLLKNVIRHKSKTEHRATNTNVLNILNKHKRGFGYTQDQAFVTNQLISEDPNAEALYNKVYKYISTTSLGEKGGDELAELTSESRENIVGALSLLVFRDLQASQQGEGGFQYLNTQFDEKYADIVQESVDRYSNVMKEGLTKRNRVPVFEGSNLSQNTPGANVMIGAFSDGPNRFLGTTIESTIRATTEAGSTLVPLDKGGQQKVVNYIKSRLPDNLKGLNLTEKLRMRHHKGNYYAVGYEDEFGNFQFLDDKAGNRILFDDGLLGTNILGERNEVEKGKEAEFVIKMLKKSDI